MAEHGCDGGACPRALLQDTEAHYNFNGVSEETEDGRNGPAIPIYTSLCVPKAPPDCVLPSLEAKSIINQGAAQETSDYHTYVGPKLEDQLKAMPTKDTTHDITPSVSNLLTDTHNAYAKGPSQLQVAPAGNQPELEHSVQGPTNTGSTSLFEQPSTTLPPVYTPFKSPDPGGGEATCESSQHEDYDTQMAQYNTPRTLCVPTQREDDCDSELATLWGVIEPQEVLNLQTQHAHEITIVV